MADLDYFKLTRDFWDFSFENPELIKPNHCALYLFIIEHCNRLGWKEKFGLPTEMSKDAIGIRSYNTYINTLNDLVDFGFIKLIEKSKNQHSSNIVGLSYFDKAHNKALDKAIVKASEKQRESNSESICSIDKHITNNNINNNISFNFRKKLIEYGFKENLVDEWLLIRKNKNVTDTETFLKKFLEQIQLASEDKNEILEFIISKNWVSFEYQWLINLQTQFKNQQIKNSQNGNITTEQQSRELYLSINSDGILR